MLSRTGLAALLVLVCPARSTAAEDPERSGFAWWRLRSTDVTTTGSTGAAAPERRDAKPGIVPTAGERRAVRVVYPGLIAGR